MTTNLTFRNPVSFTAAEITNPDPFVMEYLGEYYCYSTSVDGVQVSRSKDLVNWEYLGFAFKADGRESYWAPAVVYRNGLFYLYVSDRPEGAEDPHQQRMRVATSETPAGPFRHATYFKDFFAIDADVIFDEDGHPHLFYSSNEFTEFDEDHPGTGVVYEPLKDMVTLGGNPRPVIVPSLEEEVFEENRFGDGRDWHTIEGSAYFEHRGRGYMTYSGNAYVRENYFIGYSTADVSQGFEGAEWTKYPDNETFQPLMARNTKVEGTGHNSVIQAPNLVDWWIAYHGRDADQPLLLDKEQRVMRLDRLWFENGQLKSDGPTSDERQRPRRAELTETFSDKALPLWQTDSQVDSVDGNLVFGADSTIVTQAAFGPYVSKTWIRSNTKNGCLGIITEWLDAENHTTVWICGDKNRVTVQRTTNGQTETVAGKDLYDFDVSAWQPIRVERGLTSTKVERDGQILAHFDTAPSVNATHVGFASAEMDVQVQSFRLTQHADWYTDQPGLDLLVEKIPPTGNLNGGTVLDLVEDVPAHTELTFDFQFETNSGRVFIASSQWDEPIEVSPDENGFQTVNLKILRSGVEVNIQGAEGVKPLSSDNLPLRLTLQDATLTGLAQTSIK